MKAYSKYIALAAVAVSFAACQQEEMDITSQDDLVRIEATIGNLPQTRVEHTGTDGVTKFTQDDAIYVVNTLRNTKNAATYTMDEDGKTWNTTETLVWNGGTEKNNQFNAWYPASVMTKNDGKFTLTSQANGVGAFDLMTATTESMTKTDDGKLSLTFNHLLTKVTVTLSEWGTEIEEGIQFFKRAEFYTNTAITLDGTTIGSTATPTWIEACLIGEQYSQESFTAIICPGEPAVDDNGCWLKVEVGNGNTLAVKPNGNFTSLEPGKHYAYTLKVGKDLLVVESVTVTPWGEETIEAPNAEEE